MTVETAPEMHLGAAGLASRPCKTCGTIFTPKRAWAEFHEPRCRNAYHASEARLEALKKSAPTMYAALAEIAGHGCKAGIANCWCAACVAGGAIKDLKPPVEPKALLEKAKA